MSKVGMPLVRYFAKNIAVAIGLVLIWRGMWYLPDKDLKEIEKL